MPLNSRDCENMTDAEFLAHFLTSDIEFSIYDKKRILSLMKG